MLRSSLNIWRSRPVGDTLVMRHPLTSNLETLDTGQSVTKSGTVTFGTYNGKKSGRFYASGYLTLGSPFFDWTKGFAYSIWAYFSTSGNNRTFISAGDSNGGLSMSKNNSNQYNTFGNTFTATIGTGAWHHIAATLDDTGTIITVYRDGVSVGTYTRAMAPGVGDISLMAIGSNVPGLSYHTREVYLCDARIYASCLSSNAIAEIYQEGDNP